MIRNQSSMKYISTKANHTISIEEALFSGTSKGGGLYMPESIPQIKTEEFNTPNNFQEFSYQLLSYFFAGSTIENDLENIVSSSLNFPVIHQNISEDKNHYSVLELFHGPTAAFKDFGARFLASSMSTILKRANRSNVYTILVATSGDTGGAVASAFYQRPEFRVVVLFPEGRVSPRQYHQLTCWGKNITSLAVKGEFDDCQRLVKEAFNNPELSYKHNLCSANSINIGRLLPQTTYYAWSSIQNQKITGLPSSFIIPTGNLGNAFACFIAKEMGFPIDRIIFATNANRTIPDFIATKEWSPRPTLPTLASAMDVGNPSNMERFFYQYQNTEELLSVLESFSVSDNQIKDQIRYQYENNKVAICPHTATAFHAYRNLPTSYLEGSHWTLVATAHPAKFENIVEPIINKEVQIPDNLKTLLALESSSHSIEPSLEELIFYLS